MRFFIFLSIKNFFDLHSVIGKDAVRPFIVDLPNKMYEETKTDVDVMFSFCSAVRMVHPFDSNAIFN